MGGDSWTKALCLCFDVGPCLIFVEGDLAEQIGYPFDSLVATRTFFSGGKVSQSWRGPTLMGPVCQILSGFELTNPVKQGKPSCRTWIREASLTRLSLACCLPFAAPPATHFGGWSKVCFLGFPEA